jgi:hypothetical protein
MDMLLAREQVARVLKGQGLGDGEPVESYEVHNRDAWEWKLPDGKRLLVTEECLEQGSATPERILEALGSLANSVHRRAVLCRAQIKLE